MNQLAIYLNNSLTFIRDFSSLSLSVFSQVFKRPFYYRLVIQNMYDFGYRSLFIVISFAVSVGMVFDSSYWILYRKIWRENLCFKNYDAFTFIRDRNRLNCIHISW